MLGCLVFGQSWVVRFSAVALLSRGECWAVKEDTGLSSMLLDCPEGCWDFRGVGLSKRTLGCHRCCWTVLKAAGISGVLGCQRGHWAVIDAVGLSWRLLGFQGCWAASGAIRLLMECCLCLVALYFPSI